MAKVLFAMGGPTEQVNKLIGLYPDTLLKFDVNSYSEAYSIASFIEEDTSDKAIDVWFDFTEIIESDFDNLSWRTIIIGDVQDEIESSSYEANEDINLLDAFGVETNITIDF